jgi:M6 family metalloprotease-like protein
VAPPLRATGSRPMVAILVQFQDQPAQTTPATWQSRLFGATGSVKHYYGSASYGHFDVTPASESYGTANDGIVGWLTLPYDHPNFGSDFEAGQRLAHDAMVAADPYVNFAGYDTNGDGIVSADELLVVVIVAGNEAAFYDACAPNIWAHRWSVVPGVTLDDVQLAPYAMVGEMHCTASEPPGQPATVGVMVHEIGHLLGLPDLYDVDVSSEGVGNWGVMGGGTWNGTGRAGDSPSLMDPWSKYVLGWVTPTRVTSTLSHQPIPTAATDPTVFQFLAGSPTAGGEYFLVENRQRTGYDAGLPGSGLLVWHIDEAEADNRRECVAGGTPACSASVHYKVAVVQADDLFGLEKKLNRGDGGDPFPGTSNRRAFTSATTPSSRRYSRAASGMSVIQISDSAATMTATLAIETLSGAPFGVGGRVTAAGVGLGGVTLTFTLVSGTGALPAPVQTTATGTWAQTGFESGTTYRATPSRTGIVFTPTSLDFTAASTGLNFTSATRITVTTPNGGEVWGIGGLYTIRWTSASLSGNVKVLLSRDGGTTWAAVATSVANTGSYAWTVTGTTANPTARIRVCSVTAPVICDDSNADFSIVPRSVTLTAPNGAEIWPIGTVQTIRWTSAGILGNVNLSVSRNATATLPTWTLLFGNTLNDGIQAWTVTGPAITTARIKVCTVATPVICDTSNANFTIQGTVHVVAPNGGERWPIGVVRRITWASSVPGNVKIDVSRDGGATWAAIAASTTNDTALDWTVTGPFTTQARVRVCSVSLPAICDTSDANFTIGVADLIATSIGVTQPSLRGLPWRVESLVVKNAGTAPAVASVTYVYLVMNNIYYFMTSIDIPALAVGEIVDAHSAFITLPTSLPVGTYAIGIHLDVTGVVPETNENNWYFASPLSVFMPSTGGDTAVAPAASAPMPLHRR